MCAVIETFLTNAKTLLPHRYRNIVRKRIKVSLFFMGVTLDSARLLCPVFFFCNFPFSAKPFISLIITLNILFRGPCQIIPPYGVHPPLPGVLLLPRIKVCGEQKSKRTRDQVNRGTKKKNREWNADAKVFSVCMRTAQHMRHAASQPCLQLSPFRDTNRNPIFCLTAGWPQ